MECPCDTEAFREVVVIMLHSDHLRALTAWSVSWLEGEGIDSAQYLVGERVQDILVDVVAGHDVGGGKERAFEGFGSLCHYAPYLLAEVVQVARVYTATQRPNRVIDVGMFKAAD